MYIINMKSKKLQNLISIFLCVSLVFSYICLTKIKSEDRHVEIVSQEKVDDTDTKKDIKWIDFDIPYEAMNDAMKVDISSYNKIFDSSEDQSNVKIDWIELLSCLAGKYYGDFNRYNQKDLNELVERLNSGESMKSISAEVNMYDFYYTRYKSILGGFIGEYKTGKETDDGIEWEYKYGLKAFSPVANGFYYNDYDDFGVNRSYGYTRSHLGHDMMGSLGTPIICVETGVVEELGWNQYGGWRIGIRSLDNERYYYYAHLRKDHPFNLSIKKGDTINAGDVIGYMGRTGYSNTENTNNIDTVHLHWGLQIVFNEEEKDGYNQIWIDLYDITKILSRNKSDIIWDEESKEYNRAGYFEDISTEKEYMDKVERGFEVISKK